MIQIYYIDQTAFVSVEFSDLLYTKNEGIFVHPVVTTLTNEHKGFDRAA